MFTELSPFTRKLCNKICFLNHNKMCIILNLQSLQNTKINKTRSIYNTYKYRYRGILRSWPYFWKTPLVFFTKPCTGSLNPPCHANSDFAQHFLESPDYTESNETKFIKIGYRISILQVHGYSMLIFNLTMGDNLSDRIF